MCTCRSSKYVTHGHADPGRQTCTSTHPHTHASKQAGRIEAAGTVSCVRVCDCWTSQVAPTESLLSSLLSPLFHLCRGEWRAPREKAVKAEGEGKSGEKACDRPHVHDAAAFEVVDAVAVVRARHLDALLAERCVRRVFLARARETFRHALSMPNILVVPATPRSEACQLDVTYASRDSRHRHSPHTAVAWVAAARLGATGRDWARRTARTRS